MSVNIFVHSSIFNCSSSDAIKIRKHLESKVDNPKFHIDDDLDLIIDEDFDRRHIKELLKWISENNEASR